MTIQSVFGSAKRAFGAAVDAAGSAVYGSVAAVGVLLVQLLNETGTELGVVSAALLTGAGIAGVAFIKKIVTSGDNTKASAAGFAISALATAGLIQLNGGLDQIATNALTGLQSLTAA